MRLKNFLLTALALQFGVSISAYADEPRQNMRTPNFLMTCQVGGTLLKAASEITKGYALEPRELVIPQRDSRGGLNFTASLPLIGDRVGDSPAYYSTRKNYFLRFVVGEHRLTVTLHSSGYTSFPFNKHVRIYLTNKEGKNTSLASSKFEAGFGNDVSIHADLLNSLGVRGFENTFYDTALVVNCFDAGG